MGGYAPREPGVRWRVLLEQSGHEGGELPGGGDKEGKGEHTKGNDQTCQDIGLIRSF